VIGAQRVYIEVQNAHQARVYAAALPSRLPFVARR